MDFYAKYEKQIVDEFEKHGNVAEYGHLKDQLKKAMTENKIDEIKRLLKDELKEYDMSFLKHFCARGLTVGATKFEEYESMDDKDHEALVMFLNANKGLELYYTERKYNYNYVKEIIKESYEMCGTKTFVISKSHKIKGRIVYQKEDKKRQISVVQEYENNKDGTRYLWFFGDKQPEKAVTYSNSQPFYSYEFESEGETFDVYYKDLIKPQDCVIEGMLINMNDTHKIGESLKVNETKKIFFAQNIVEELKDLSVEDIKEICKDWNREVLAQKMFGKLRAPRMVETLKLAFAFSGKNSGYPLHLIVIGPNGTGKTMSYLTPISINIPGAFGPKGFIDGASTTLLGLVPSYSSSKADPGLFVKASRICYIDEFFKIMSRSGFNMQSNKTGGLEPLTGLLEHRKDSRGSSGNTGDVSFTATAKALFVTNPEKGLRELPQIVEALSTPAIARFLIYQQTKEEIDWITEHIPEIMGMKEEEYLPQQDKNFVNLFDYFYKREIVIDYNKMNRIREKVKKEVPEALQDMFRTRYFHHIACVIDGISNIRFLCNEKDTLDYTDEDYVEAEHLMLYVVGSWTEGFDMNKVDIDKRFLFLHKEESDLYELVCKENGDLTEEMIEDKQSLKKLLDYRLVYDKYGYILPYFNPDVESEKGVQIRL